MKSERWADSKRDRGDSYNRYKIVYTVGSVRWIGAPLSILTNSSPV